MPEESTDVVAFHMLEDCIDELSFDMLEGCTDVVELPLRVARSNELVAEEELPLREAR